MQKKSVLFIVYDFVQAGGQKYAFEIAKAINKQEFQLDFLCMKPLNSNNARKEYYYEPTLQLGCRVRLFHLECKQSKAVKWKEWTYSMFEKLGAASAAKKIRSEIDGCKREILQQICNEYDHVNWGGTGVYKQWGRVLDINTASYIHVLSTSFQYKNDFYENWDKDKYYHFVTPLSPELVHKELRQFKNYKHTSFPLVQSGENIAREFNAIKKEAYHIAIFTRISGMKPLEPYLFALKLLIEHKVNVRLMLFGAGDPVESGLSQKIGNLYLSNHVLFMGHTESITDSLNENQVDLVWFQSANNDPAGYAAYEVALSETPQVFWDFEFVKPHKHTNEVFPSYTSITEFVQESLTVLQDKEYSRMLGKQQANFILNNKCAQKEIKILETLFSAPNTMALSYEP